jgi:glycosyltransferase involved in cell wall biosynthesis
VTLSSEPDVSVLLIAYNHERFVGRAIDSVLMQRGVSFEMIVSEDCSTDRTLQIIRSKLEGDARARLIVSERNLASNETIRRAIRAARGRYVSMLDGDDFWIVQDKLARQMKLLEADPTLSACFHNALIVRDENDEPEDQCWTPPTQRSRSGLSQLWEGNPFPTCAGMMRRDALGSVGDWYAALGKARGTAMVTDWPLYLACAEHGEIEFINEPVGAYRLHAGGCYTSLPTVRKLDVTANLYRFMDRGLGRRHHRLAAAGAASYFTGWMMEYGARGEKLLARRAAWHALRSGGIGKTFGWRRWLTHAARNLA